MVTAIQITGSKKHELEFLVLQSAIAWMQRADVPETETLNPEPYMLKPKEQEDECSRCLVSYMGPFSK